MSGESRQVFFDVAAVTRAVGSSTRFAKVLADPTLPDAARFTLLNDVAKGGLDPTSATASKLREIFAARKSNVALPAHLLIATANLGFETAANDNRLPAVENGLFQFAELVAANDELLLALTNPGASDASKQQVVDDLLSGKTDDIAIELVNVLLALDHGRNIVDRTKALATLAAKHQGHVVADVRSAVDLDESYRAKVASALSASLGENVEPRFVVDPSIIGALVVRVGDEVWDGSVRRRLQQARESLTGASS